jgi:peptide/nickel transport system substrate-binding protein
MYRLNKATRRATTLMAALGALALAAASPAAAAKLRFANDGDLPTLDFHARAATFPLGVLLNVYEPLVQRGADLKIEPALAVSWERLDDTHYRFKLRPGVRFHDGTPFTADDVVFSFARGSHPLSELRPYLATVKSVRKVDDLTVEMESTVPDPVFIDKLWVIGIMSKAWAEANHATAPVDLSKNEESFANRNANGTGPFIVKSREPGIRSVFVANPNWWGKRTHNLDEVEFVRIANAGTRTAALLSGEVDLVYNVPTQDLDRISKTEGVKLLQATDLRTVYLAMDQARDELLDSNVKGKNPFKDKRVREAVYRSIDIAAIHSRIMRGQSKPLAELWGANVNGYNAATDQRLPYSPDVAKRLLAEAGYPNGFEVGLDCPNDRFANDEATCQAMVGMLARIGIKVNLNAMTTGKWFNKILAPGYNTSFALVGWAAQTTFDAGNVIENLIQSRDVAAKKGMFNIGGYSNARVDELSRQIERELDPAKRLALIDEVARIHHAEVGHVPLHQLMINWAARANVEAKPTDHNMIAFRLIRVN